MCYCQVQKSTKRRYQKLYVFPKASGSARGYGHDPKAAQRGSRNTADGLFALRAGLSVHTRGASYSACRFLRHVHRLHSRTYPDKKTVPQKEIAGSEGEHLSLTVFRRTLLAVSRAHPFPSPSPSSRLLLLGISNIIWKFLRVTIAAFHKSKIMNFIHYA